MALNVYRTGEAELAGEVLARRADGDVDGMVQAVMDLWATPAAGEGDPWEDEVWQAVVAGGAAAECVRRGVALLEQGQLLRLSAFVRVVQNIQGLREPITAHPEAIPPALTGEDARALIELAGIAVERTWLRHGYLEAVFVKMVEGNAKRDLLDFTERNLARLGSDTATWQLRAFLLATEMPVVDILDWLRDWDRRDGVPMWIVALYVHRLRGRGPLLDPDLITTLAQARRIQPADETARYLLCAELELLLRAHDYEGLAARVDACAEELAAPLPWWWEHPVVRYVNRFKRTHRVVATHVDPVQDRATGYVDHANWANRGIVALACEMTDHVAVASRVFLLFRALARVEPRQRAVVALWRDFRSFSRPDSMRWMLGEWDRLFRAKSRWPTRVYLSLFG